MIFTSLLLLLFTLQVSIISLINYISPTLSLDLTSSLQNLAITLVMICSNFTHLKCVSKTGYHVVPLMC